MKDEEENTKAYQKIRQEERNIIELVDRTAMPGVHTHTRTHTQTRARVKKEQKTRGSKLNMMQ